MPRHGSVRMKKINPKGADADDAADLNNLFEQMTGSQNADSNIIIPKYLAIQELLKKFIKIYNLLLNFSEFIDNFSEYNMEFDEIKEFINNLEKIIKDNLSEQDLTNMELEPLNVMYKEIKNKNEIQNIIVTGGNLKKYKRYLCDKNDLKDEFIKREPGFSLKPLAFTQLDIKMLWSANKLNNMAKKYILNILNHTYHISHELYDIITSPDIDIKKFSRVLIDNIEKLKKQIPRCEKAFDIIKNSVEMLEDNFKGYYKNSVESENPSIIIESFIIDVSMKQKTNANITNQFRKIIMHMKKVSSNNSDPRIKKLFNILNSQFNMMDKKSNKPDTDSKPDDGESDSKPDDGDDNDSKPDDGDDNDSKPDDGDDNDSKPDDGDDNDEDLDMTQVGEALSELINTIPNDEKSS
jgi:hypothetical protein